MNAIVGGVIGGLAAILSFLSLWFWYRRRHWRMQSSNRRDTLQPFSLTEHQMAQTGSNPQEPPLPRRITTVIAGGKRIVRHVLPTTREREARSRSRYEVDAGPADSRTDGGETMPPQYEQVFREPAAGIQAEESAQRTRKGR